VWSAVPWMVASDRDCVCARAEPPCRRLIGCADRMLSHDDKIRLIHQYRAGLPDYMFDGLCRRSRAGAEPVSDEIVATAQSIQKALSQSGGIGSPHAVYSYSISGRLEIHSLPAYSRTGWSRMPQQRLHRP